MFRPRRNRLALAIAAAAAFLFVNGFVRRGTLVLIEGETAAVSPHHWTLALAVYIGATAAGHAFLALAGQISFLVKQRLGARGGS